MNKSWKQHLTKQQLYNHLPPISKTIQIRRTKYVGHSWKSKNELISDIFLWTPSHGRPSVGWPTRTYLQQFCMDTGCSLENLQGRWMIDEWRERERERESGKFVQEERLDDNDDDDGNCSRIRTTLNWNLLNCLKIGLVTHPARAELLVNTYFLGQRSGCKG